MKNDLKRLLALGAIPVLMFLAGCTNPTGNNDRSSTGQRLLNVANTIGTVEATGREVKAIGFTPAQESELFLAQNGYLNSRPFANTNLNEITDLKDVFIFINGDGLEGFQIEGYLELPNARGVFIIESPNEAGKYIVVSDARRIEQMGDGTLRAGLNNLRIEGTNDRLPRIPGMGTLR